MRRRLLPALVCFAAVVSLATAALAQPNGQGRRLRVSLNGDENNITPFTVSFGATPYTHDLISLVYDSLFWSQVKTDPEPWLAERATPSNDFREWTVTLRDGITWHDGRPLTAEDVKFSFDYYNRFPGASGRYAHHVSDTPKLQSATVVDARTVRFVYGEPAPTFKIMPGADLPIIPKHIWENVTEPSKFTADLPVGTGPYKVVEMVRDQRYRLEANANYFKGKPTVDVLELPIVKDPAAAFAALRTGELDSVARNVPPELMAQFESGGVRVAEGTKFESVQMYLNARKAPLTDPKLRKAIALAIDTRALVDTVLLGHGRPGVDSFIHPDSPWALPGARHEHDPARAQRMLDEAGYATRDPDGVRKTADGRRLEFSVLVSSFEPSDLRAVQLAAQQVAPIGVKLNPEALDPATLRQRRTGPPGQPPPYDAYMSTLESHGHVDPDALYYFFHSPGPKGFGASIAGYSNPRFDQIVEEATTKDVAERKPLLYEAQRILAEETPGIVFYYPDGDYAYRPAAYEGWVSDLGHGIFTKRSFLTEYVEQSSVSSDGGGGAAVADDDGSGSGGVVLAILAGVVVLGAGALLVNRRRRAAVDADD
ncbi:MAG TPA: ABC transporter substrate-binding protein [Acidimicrobiales bacterium]|nr:ABC transporter substrate-binding protein [Acidimicrobiales bacterium]